MNRSVLFVIGGAILGVMVARTFVFDPIEVLAWSMFWSALFEGNLMSPGALLESTTFWKSVGGAVLGGAAGHVANARLAASASAPSAEHE